MLKTIEELSDSTAVAISATLTEEKNSYRLKANIMYNYDRWMNAYSHIVISLNGEKEWCDLFEEQIKQTLPDTEIVILYSENIGKYLGNADNTNKIFRYTSQRKDIEYILKISGDVLSEDLNDLYIDTDYDFFYVNNIYSSLLQQYTPEELRDDILNQKYFSPVNHYYVIKNKIGKLSPDEAEITKLKDSNFENIFDESETHYDACNDWLAELVKVNELKPKNLLEQQDVEKIIDIIKNYPMDESHKNIIYHNAGRICHYHYMEYPILDIE